MSSKNIELISIKEYVSVLKKVLPSYVFQTNKFQLIVIFLHSIGVISFIALSVMTNNVFLKIIYSIVAGHSLGVIGLIGHEVLHGTVVKKRRWQYLVGGYCIFQFGLHPKMWKAWHNVEHHQSTQDPKTDPDCFGHVLIYKKSKVLRFLETIAPGSGKKRSFFFLFYWFSLHTIIVAFFDSKSFLDFRYRLISQIYLIFILASWIFLTLFLGGFNAFVFAFLIPLSISNFLMMSYIATQHFLSPLTVTTNDPLINSLTVRSPKWIERLHVNTGYHAVHHIFPSLNPKYAPIVNDAIKELWPGRIREMSHLKALKQIYRTPRFYSKWNVLQNPRTGEKVQTLYSSMDNDPVS
ncbi:MAG: fatty acid desaturase [Cocleimonas sp.]